jgi:hypothetical protein
LVSSTGCRAKARGTRAKDGGADPGNRHGGGRWRRLLADRDPEGGTEAPRPRPRADGGGPPLRGHGQRAHGDGIMALFGVPRARGSLFQRHSVALRPSAWTGSARGTARVPVVVAVGSEFTDGVANGAMTGSTPCSSEPASPGAENTGWSSAPGFPGRPDSDRRRCGQRRASDCHRVPTPGPRRPVPHRARHGRHVSARDGVERDRWHRRDRGATGLRSPASRPAAVTSPRPR